MLRPPTKRIRVLLNVLRGLGVASFLAAALLTSACGGGGASGILTGIGGGGGGTNPGGGGGGPTSSPIPPTPTPLPSVTTVPLVIGKAIAFPLSEGFGGSLTFPTGSGPASGVNITLETQLTVPTPPYPNFIKTPPGEGANATDPMLTFSLSSSVTLSGPLTVGFTLASACQSGAYFVALYAVSPTTNVKLDSEQATCNGTSGLGHVSSGLRRPFAVRRAGRGRAGVRGTGLVLSAGTTYYAGVFFEPGGPGPSPSPTAVPSPVSVTKPMAAGSAITFPTVGGDGGSITFPDGSAPITGNSITLTTALSIPDGYPTTIPPGFNGVGASAVAPWMTYRLAKTLNTPGGSNIIVQFSFATNPPDGDYYLGIYDITQNPNVPLGTAPIQIIPSLRTRGQPARLSVRVRLHGRGHGIFADQIPAGDKMYVGLFYLQGGSAQNNQSINSLGGTCALTTGIVVPAFGGFEGCLDYAPNDASGGTIMTVTSATTDFTGGLAPPPKVGTPVFYLGLQITAGNDQLVSFHPVKNLNATLSSPTLIGGAAYDLFGYDVSSSAPVQFYQAGPLQATNCPIPSQGTCISFATPLTNDSLTLDDQYLIEVVQD
jgi:hypothetical protein